MNDHPDNSKQAVWMALGALTMAWSTYEFLLFDLFVGIMRADPYKARILWFNLASLQLRLKLVRQMVQEGAAGNHKEAVLQATKQALDFNDQRNEYVHRQWAKSTSGGWSIIGPRDLRKEWHRTATATDVMRLAAEVADHGKVVLEISKMLPPLHQAPQR